MRCLMFLLAIPLLAADDLGVKVDGGNTIQLGAEANHREIRAAVTATSFTVKGGEAPQIIEVSLNGVRQKAWSDWFHARWEPATGKPASLVIGVSDELKKSGTYNVVLLLRPELPKLILQIVQPAAQLEIPEKLLVARTQYLPLMCCNPDSFSFDVRETSGAADVTDIQLFNKQATQGNESVPGTLALQQPDRIRAGRAATLHYNIRGDYPRGSVAGSLKLIAPQLVQPIVLPYEVHTRLHAFYLLLAILAGLACSYYVRTLLQNRIQLSQARLQADEILQEIADNLSNYDDKVRADIQQAKSQLETAVAATNVETMKQRAETLRTAWTTAIGDFNTRSAKASSEFGELQGLLSLEWIIPTPCAAGLVQAKAHVAEAKDRLQQRQVDRAQVSLDDGRAQLANSLHNTGRAWQNDARGLAATFSAATAGVPESVRTQFAALMQQAPPELNRITNDPIPADVPSARRALEDLQTELAGFANLLARLAAMLRSEWNAIAPVWRDTPNLPHPELVETLAADFLVLSGELQTAAANPKPLLDSLPDRLARLQEEWRDAIVRQLPGNEASLARLQTEIDNRNFGKAVQNMSAILQGAEPVWGDVDGAAARPQVAVGEAGQTHAPRQHFTILDLSGGAAAPSVIPGLPRFRILQSLNHAQLLQTAIVGALTALWAFTSYSQTWDGTWTGLLAPLLGAFLLDVSVEGLKNQVQKKA